MAKLTPTQEVANYIYGDKNALEKQAISWNKWLIARAINIDKLDHKSNQQKIQARYITFVICLKEMQSKFSFLLPKPILNLIFSRNYHFYVLVHVAIQIQILHHQTALGKLKHGVQTPSVVHKHHELPNFSKAFIEIAQEHKTLLFITFPALDREFKAIQKLSENYLSNDVITKYQKENYSEKEIRLESSRWFKKKYGQTPCEAFIKIANKHNKHPSFFLKKGAFPEVTTLEMILEEEKRADLI